MVFISDTALPFVVIHNEIKLRPKSFVKVSVRFVPISGNAKDMMQSVLAENVTHSFFTSEQSCRLLGIGGRYSMIYFTFSNSFYIFSCFCQFIFKVRGNIEHNLLLRLLMDCTTQKLLYPVPPTGTRN